MNSKIGPAYLAGVADPAHSVLFQSQSRSISEVHQKNRISRIGYAGRMGRIKIVILHIMLDLLA